MIQTRIGDAEREAAAARLGDNFAQGRLDLEEFNERLDAIWTARTQADLGHLFLDLPRPPATRSPAQRPPRAGRTVPAFLAIVAIAALAMMTMMALMAAVKVIPWVLLMAAVWFVVLRPRRRHRLQGTAAQVRVRRPGRLAP